MTRKTWHHECVAKNDGYGILFECNNKSSFSIATNPLSEPMLGSLRMVNPVLVGTYIRQMRYLYRRSRDN